MTLPEPVHRRAAVDIVEPDAGVRDVEMARVLIGILVGMTDERPFPLFP